MSPFLLSGLLIAAPDALLASLEAEMKRSMARLRLPPAGPPYYMSYTVYETIHFQASASFGALVEQNRAENRHLTVDVRVGNHALDNTNFADDESRGGDYYDPVPIDADETAIRRAVWLKTDRAYKRAVEQREKKVAFLQAREVKDRPNDFSKEPPNVSLAASEGLAVDSSWSDEVRRLSTIFRRYPRISASAVVMSAAAKNRWFVNSEGSRVRFGSKTVELVVVAAAQAEDGMRLLDYEVLAAGKDLAKDPSIEGRIVELAERLTKLTTAPHVERYRGPVVFEGGAAAEFISEALGPHVSAPREVLGPRGFEASAYPMRDEIGRRVLPRFITIVDDPTLREHGGVPIVGGYAIDDDGVKARRITLVNRGVLETFCMSRVPTRELSKSNGHSMRGWGALGTLLVSSERTMPVADLKRTLIELGSREELEHVYIVRKMSSSIPYGVAPWVGMTGHDRRRGSSEVSLSDPMLLYRVSVRDGSETLVRGAAFGNHSLRVLRDIEATGDDVRVHPIRFYGEVKTVVTPSLLVEEVEIETATEELDKPPLLPNPHFEKK